MSEPIGSCTLGEVIRARRVEMGLTQEELAERIGAGCRQAEISRLERGKVGLPRRARLERIAAALGLPMGELLSRSGWAGADAALGRVAERPPPDDRPSDAVAPASIADPALPPRPELSPRLRAAVERSHELRAWSAELQHRTATTLERANRSPREHGSAPRPPALEGQDHEAEQGI